MKLQGSNKSLLNGWITMPSCPHFLFLLTNELNTPTIWIPYV
jgi:hypothetical protein